MESQDGKSYFGECKLCGQKAALDENGMCQNCKKKFEKGAGENQQSKGYTDINRTTYYADNPFKVKKEHSCLSSNKLIRGFNGFYKFFHTGSIVASIVIFLGWIIYLIWGSSQNLSDQVTAAESYARGLNQTVQKFDPRWDVFFAAILILIFGTFLSYICEAIAKMIEKASKDD